MNNDFPILVVEDNPVSRKLLEKILRKAGYEVTSAENGQRALELFKKRFFPVVLTDWMMPEMDGLQLCKAIRKDSLEGYVFIILLTVKDSKNDIVAGLESGADDYLVKPPNHAELIARIKTGIRILELERSLKKANDEIKVISITDPLTGCYNRSYMTEYLPREIMRAKRYGRPLSLVLCDIDRFKKVNDTYGHQTGDHVLKHFVQCIKDSVRNNIDWVARYGGEEFVIVCPETDINGAYNMSERLRKVISRMAIEIEEKEIYITASFGISSFDPSTQNEMTTSEALIKKADRYLYQAKQEGRNRVIGGEQPVT